MGRSNVHNYTRRYWIQANITSETICKVQTQNLTLTFPKVKKKKNNNNNNKGINEKKKHSNNKIITRGPKELNRAPAYEYLFLERNTCWKWSVRKHKLGGGWLVVNSCFMSSFVEFCSFQRRSRKCLRVQNTV